jgi:hypothetical protein
VSLSNEPEGAAVRLWNCPSCQATAGTADNQPGTPMHVCKGLAGLTVPLVPVGDRSVHRINMREDYVNGDDVQTDGDGRVVMSVTTEHADGHTDCTVFAPCATASGRAL